MAAADNQRLFAISVRLNIVPLLPLFFGLSLGPSSFISAALFRSSNARRWIIVRNRVIRLRGAILSRRISLLIAFASPFRTRSLSLSLLSVYRAIAMVIGRAKLPPLV